MSRLPIRVRLTLAFAVAMAVVLAAIGALVYVRLQSSLDGEVDSGLQARATDLAALAAQGDTGLATGSPRGLIEPEESFAQVLDAQGRVVDATPQVGRKAVVAPSAISGDASTYEREVPGIEGRARLLATTVDTTRGRRIVVVGASLQDRDE